MGGGGEIGDVSLRANYKTVLPSRGRTLTCWNDMGVETYYLSVLICMLVKILVQDFLVSFNSQVPYTRVYEVSIMYLEKAMRSKGHEKFQVFSV